MNIAVINAKDLFRYILKFLVIVSITFFMIKLVKTVDLKKQEENIKENGNNIKKQINEYSFTKCLDISIPLMEYGKKESEKENFFTNNKILAMGANILDEAILENTDYVEIDLRITKDNQVVVFHDNNLKRVDNSNLKIEDMTLEEVKKIDNGSYKYKLFSEEKIPTLEELFKRYKNKVKFNFHLKVRD